MDSRGEPILVTGLPRSGTSWVGKMLEPAGAVYVNEPLNPSHPPGRSPGVLDADVAHYFQYICPDNEWPWLRAFGDTVALRFGLGRELRRNHRPYDLPRAAKYGWFFWRGRRARRPALLDDPYAVFSVPWLIDRVGVRAVVLIRDPVAIVGSWRRLGWTVDPAELLAQPLLMRDHLEPYRSELAELAGSDDWLATTALLWRVIYATVHQVLAGRDGVLLRRYEDLAAEPVKEFRTLHEHLGLRWDAAAKSRVVEATTTTESGHRGFRWSLRGGLSRTAYRPMNSAAALATQGDRLTSAERTRVLELTSDVRELFY